MAEFSSTEYLTDTQLSRLKRIPPPHAPELFSLPCYHSTAPPATVCILPPLPDNLGAYYRPAKTMVKKICPSPPQAAHAVTSAASETEPWCSPVGRDRTGAAAQVWQCVPFTLVSEISNEKSCIPTHQVFDPAGGR